MDDSKLIEGLLSSVIPELSDHSHKGQSGRIGVIGGCKEFTGAPYYASISSLKIGADLVYVFCASDAAIPIKSYSPELIVLPVLDSKDVIATVSQYMPRLHALIIGPGLGRDEALTQTVFSLITKAREFDLPLLLDADSLHFICKQPDVIKNYKKAILTPNAIEFSRLHNLIFQHDLNDQERDSPGEKLKEMCSKLGNVTIVRKGRQDLISDGNMLISCDQYGSNRRCGGQGDLLVGSMATFAFWSHANKQMKGSLLDTNQLNPCILAAYAACLFTRKCNKLAFEKLGRTMTTTDMIRLIPKAFEGLFPTKFRS
ncbi:ATP-dependent (S)-NAD(P)H-hydrate dehydratase isoform X1 [Tetranychus urticae]|uniref:ATP-dependent (S)-NAD(P)H-hydrate dehydratase n=1 Tax=Tetranychus urticae TaxID=32264 RepID=T1KDE9_TETUR|nr:ATP-dependent (S)-NAD(P)H-hydrate dehydratase isoform X1 [Tetranychus urticae]XP_015785743.1 ATP-dependent (S)-NAD(P)H-hydrate dehydratase isoform X1 [Tetranychus urticae]XP_025016835.1 ATP-dependent (S)-NAD(P)H-hydrate dehydratase isoform X1 [Tetranychus urticae]